MTKYNGHKNWNHWNVSLWINNDEGLYRLAKSSIRNMGRKDWAADAMLKELHLCGIHETPDGAPYTKTTIRAAMAGM